MKILTTEVMRRLLNREIAAISYVPVGAKRITTINTKCVLLFIRTAGGPQIAAYQVDDQGRWSTIMYIPEEVSDDALQLASYNISRLMDNFIEKLQGFVERLSLSTEVLDHEWRETENILDLPAKWINQAEFA